MSNYTDEYLKLHNAQKLRDMEKHLSESNKHAAQMIEQNRKDAADREEERKEEQRRRDNKEWSDKREREHEREISERKQKEQEKAEIELQRVQASRDAEIQERITSQENKYISTIDKLTSEMSDLKTILSLPESERAGYLKQQEEAIKQKTIKEDEKRKAAEIKKREEDRLRAACEQNKIKKLRDIIERFRSEGIEFYGPQPICDAFFYGRKYFNQEDLADIFAQIGGKKISFSNIDTDITSDMLDEWILNHHTFIENKKAKALTRKAEALKNKEAEELRKAAELQAYNDSKQQASAKVANRKRNKLIYNAIMLGLFVFMLYELWNRSFFIALGTFAVLFIMWVDS